MFCQHPPYCNIASTTFMPATLENNIMLYFH